MTPDLGRTAARAALAALFRRHGLVTPDLDARVLLCAACDIDHAGLVRDPDLLLGPAADRLTAWGHRRAGGEPVCRIIGQREFWGLPIDVTPAVLDPRPETEGLVGAVIDAVGGRGVGPLRILDLGTGSGAILCALLRELPQADGVAIDSSFAACKVARGNLARLGFLERATVVCGSWGEALRTRFDVVVSNPPYIPRGDIAGLSRDVRDHDPLPALDGGEDGLDAYRAIAPMLPGLLGAGGVAAFECGWNQGAALTDLLSEVLHGIATYRDLAGHDRVVVGLAGQATDARDGVWRQPRIRGRDMTMKSLGL